MENLISAVKNALNNVNIEIHNNIVYQIKHTCSIQKGEIKAYLPQGNVDKPHTIVELDFVKTTGKLSRKQKNILKNNRIFNRETDINSISDGILIKAVSSDMPDIKIYNSPIYIYGEYKKYSREMSQSPLVIGGKAKTEKCVSDFIYEFQRFFGSAHVKFMACGREDIDVRCTGGRPFVLEIPYPTANLRATHMNITLNSYVDIVNTKLVTKKCKELINLDESTKLYDLIIFSKEKLKLQNTYELEQKTPLRVLHRRANLVRSRTIEILEHKEEERENGLYYFMSIRASSGAYIKEWVNGDFGRTVPSLNADLLLLDVAGVEKHLDQNTAISEFEIIKNYAI